MTDNESAEFQARQHIKAITFHGSERSPAEFQALSEELRSLQDDIMLPFFTAIASKEEQMLVEVLQEHLGRLVVTDDFKDCAMKFLQSRPDEYIFAYKGTDLGIVKKEMKLDFDDADFTKNMYRVQEEIIFRRINRVG